MRSRADPSGCLVGPPLKKGDSEEEGPFTVLPVFAAYPDASAAVAADIAAAAAAAAAGGGPPPRSNFRKKVGSGGRGAKREKGAPTTAAAAAAASTATAAAAGAAHPKVSERRALLTAAAAAEGAPKREREETPEGPPDGSYELAGLITLYTFYALTGYRRRLSQCLVFPHVQSKGIGMRSLEFVYQDIILDPQVIEFTVEDPATSFCQLRDVVCLKMAVDLGLVSAETLFPLSVSEGQQQQQQQQQGVKKEEVQQQSVSAVSSSYLDQRASHSAPPGVACAECFRRVLKETKTQAVRLTEILALAAVLPEPPPPPLMEVPNLDGKRDWRQSDAPLGCTDTSDRQQQQQQLEAAAGQGSAGALRRPSAGVVPRGSVSKRGEGGPPPRGPPKEQAFHQGPACSAVRQRIKQRLKREKYDMLAELPMQQQRMELDRKWTETYTRYFRTIVKLRRLLGKSSTAAAAAATAQQETADGSKRKRQRRGSTGT